MDVLDLMDPDSRRWLDRQLPRLHFLVGDSVARDCGLQSRIRRDRFRNRARGGVTWATLDRDLPAILRSRDDAATARGRQRGDVVVWLSGNDVYNRQSLLPSFSPESLESVAVHANNVSRKLLEEANSVVVLGPLPRLSGEMFGARWEQTAAFHLERRLRHGLPKQVRFIPLGRQLTRKEHNRHAITPGCLPWYQPDRTHLSPAGYEKLQDSLEFPIWITMAAAGPTQ